MAALRDALNLDGVHYVESILIDWLAREQHENFSQGTLATSGYPIRYYPLHEAGCDRQHHISLG